MKILIAEMSRSMAEGPAWSALRLARVLCDRHEFAIIATQALADDYRRRGLWDGPLHSVDMPRPRFASDPSWWLRFVPHAARAAREVERILRIEKPDAVIINSIINVHAARAARKLGIPALWYVREFLPPRRADDLFIRWAAKRTNFLVSVSDAVRDRLVAGGAPPDRVRTVRNDTPFVESDPAAAHRMRESLVGDAGPVIAIVGSIDKRKGHHVLVDAAAKLMPQFPKLRILAAGTAIESEDYAVGLRKRIHERGLDEVYRLIGPCDNVFTLFEASDIAVQPSTTPDPLPRAVIEAAASGRPVVGSSIGGIPEMIREGITGLIVPPDDPAALADALRELLPDAPRLHAMGDAARKLARTEFNADVLASGIEDLLETAMRNHSGPTGQIQ